MTTINIAKDFSETPLGRYREDNDFSGEAFREDMLRPAIQDYKLVRVKIDEVEGYGSSFLEEAFGGLVRKGYFTASELEKKLQIVLDDTAFEMHRELIWRYIRRAKREK
ncbi:MAG TPA: STAS-like domain-containing protein [Tepidisphaeraceae bacterium]|jgi:hypothetical protein|nr:STAS-like domain-containing protein [Tepidisphaeraceae bacterium]